ncbi:MAG: site-specific DNA-methyltransferase [Verrucomicrobiales bacterium]|nr:site-specific DNA-methyltransferase [Verrucomicrobiales bacterium]
MAKKKSASKKSVSHYGHEDASRKNIPSAEMQPVVRDEVREPIPVSYDRTGESFPEESAGRNADLDPQLVWRGKDDGPLEVQAPALYIQEKVHPKALIDDLLRQTRTRAGVEDEGYYDADLFGDFNGLPEEAKSTDFYRHEGHWSNRMILGDALQVMSSLSEREGLRGKVQCIYLDPPYGIKFNSNFQWSTTSRDVKDGKANHISREPEQVKAFRDTWRDGIHSYLTYLRDRLIVARELLTESGSVFVQIGDENVHRVRALMDEVFGEENFVSLITIQKTGGLGSASIRNVSDFVIWFCKDRGNQKFRRLFKTKAVGDGTGTSARYDLAQNEAGFRRRLTKEEKQGLHPLPEGERACQLIALTSIGANQSTTFEFSYQFRKYSPPMNRCWSTNREGLKRAISANRVTSTGSSLRFLFYLDDYPAYELNNVWNEFASPAGKVYVVQSHAGIVERCLLMTTDPGDLVLDPTCGSGTTAYVAEQWGRRWITIDTSRVALALARARIMGARYPYYLLADSREGQVREAEVTRTAPSEQPTHGHLSHGFVYERVPHITLKSIANNAEIDVIHEQFEEKLVPLAEQITNAVGPDWLTEFRKDKNYDIDLPDTIQEWEMPRDFPESWPEETKKLHTDWWDLRIDRQKEIDASIAAKADFEYLYDKPYEDKSKARVAGPFTVESVAPHRMLSVDENDELVDSWDKVAEQSDAAYGGRQQDFTSVILENLRSAGVQQSNKEDRIHFTSIEPVAGSYVCAVGTYTEGNDEDAPQRKAGIFIGPEFGTVQKPDLVRAAREAAEIGYDVLIACAFNYDAHSTEFEKLGGFPVLKARMNADLHMADDLKNTGKGNLFVIFGEPDIDIETLDDGQLQVRLNGVDIFKPSSGEVVSSDAKDIACWFIDTDYNEESFFVRHAYFLGQNDPYKALKTTLKSEIDEEAWQSLNRDTSRPFDKPATGRIAVKVINHLGDEVMKVFSV